MCAIQHNSLQTTSDGSGTRNLGFGSILLRNGFTSSWKRPYFRHFLPYLMIFQCGRRRRKVLRNFEKSSNLQIWQKMMKILIQLYLTGLLYIGEIVHIIIGHICSSSNFLLIQRRSVKPISSWFRVLHLSLLETYYPQTMILFIYILLPCPTTPQIWNWDSIKNNRN